MKKSARLTYACLSGLLMACGGSGDSPDPSTEEMHKSVNYEESGAQEQKREELASGKQAKDKKLPDPSPNQTPKHPERSLEENEGEGSHEHSSPEEDPEGEGTQSETYTPLQTLEKLYHEIFSMPGILNEEHIGDSITIKIQLIHHLTEIRIAKGQRKEEKKQELIQTINEPYVRSSMNAPSLNHLIDFIPKAFPDSQPKEQTITPAAALKELENAIESLTVLDDVDLAETQEALKDDIEVIKKGKDPDAKQELLSSIAYESIPAGMHQSPFCSTIAEEHGKPIYPLAVGEHLIRFIHLAFPDPPE